MAKLVITTFGSLGDLHPYIGLALGLKQRGHDAILATLPCYRAASEQVGIGFHPVRPDLDPGDRALVRRVMQPVRGSRVLLLEVVLPYLIESYRDLYEIAHDADMLITHPLTYAGPLIAEQHQIPWAATVLAPISLFSAYDPPVIPQWPGLMSFQHRYPAFNRLLFQAVKFYTRSWSKPIKQLRAELGLAPAQADPFYEGQYSPFLNLALYPTVLATPQIDWPANTLVTGQMNFDGDQDENAPELPDRVMEFLAAGPAPVVFTLGSSAALAAGDFYTESLKAVTALGIRAILVVGDDPDTTPQGTMPANVLISDYLPYSRLFPRAAAIVHHCGIGTTSQALRSGKPILAVPFAFDQPDNAFRLTRLGVARTLPRSRYKANRIINELRALLEHPAYTETAAEIGRKVRAEEGVKVACDAIEKTLGKTTN